MIKVTVSFQKKSPVVCWEIFCVLLPLYKKIYIQSFDIYRVEPGKKTHSQWHKEPLKKKWKRKDNFAPNSSLVSIQLTTFSWMDILQRNHFPPCAPSCFSGGITSGWTRKIQKDATEITDQKPLRYQSERSMDTSMFLQVSVSNTDFISHLYLLTTLFQLSFLFGA